MLLYVNDMIITRDDQSDILELHDHLHEYFEMKTLGTLWYFLGLEISDSFDGYYLFQVKYASDLLTQADLTNSKTAPTLLDFDCYLIALDDILFDNHTLYHQ